MTCFFDRIEKNPIIAEVKSLKDLDYALKSSCEIIFILTGNIFNLKEIAYRVKKENKALYIHIDSLNGFSKDTWGLEYIIKNIHPEGIISNKNSLISLSKNMGIFTIQNLFVIDSESLHNGIKNIISSRPNLIKLSPGIMPRITKKIIRDTNMPLISSGLISHFNDLDLAIDAGSIGVSTSNKGIWKINYTP